MPHILREITTPDGVVIGWIEEPHGPGEEGGRSSGLGNIVLDVEKIAELMGIKQKKDKDDD